jgi:hypothetical protein
MQEKTPGGRALARAERARASNYIVMCYMAGGGREVSRKRCGNEVLGVQIRICLALTQLLWPPVGLGSVSARGRDFLKKNSEMRRKFSRRDGNFPDARSAGFGKTSKNDPLVAGLIPPTGKAIYRKS